MTPPLEENLNDLDICPFLKKECLEADDDDMENYCVLNYENCLEYRKHNTEVERKRYNKDKGGNEKK
jgi:hypothetical protein